MLHHAKMSNALTDESNAHPQDPYLGRQNYNSSSISNMRVLKNVNLNNVWANPQQAEQNNAWSGCVCKGGLSGQARVVLSNAESAFALGRLQSRQHHRD
jgi:hypothetical protein